MEVGASLVADPGQARTTAVISVYASGPWPADGRADGVRLIGNGGVLFHRRCSSGCADVSATGQATDHDDIWPAGVGRALGASGRSRLTSLR